MADQFDAWNARLRGENPEHTRGVCESGYWRIRERTGKIIPVFLWREDDNSGRLCCIRNCGEPFYVEREEEFAEQVFAYAIKNPVSSVAYKFYKENGKWPEDVTPIQDAINATVEALGSNAPQDLVIRETVADLRTEAEEWLKGIGGVVQTQAHADRAANYADRFAGLEKEAESTRVREKEPHLVAGRDVDAKWHGVKKAADDAKRWTKGLLTPFLEAERTRRLQQAAQASAAGKTVNTDELKVRAGTRGRQVALKSRKQLKITNEQALWDRYVKDERFRNDPDVRAVLERLAFGDLTIGTLVLGAEIETVETAA